MNLSRDDIEQFAQAARVLERASRTIESIDAREISNSSRASVTFDAGGIGLWLAVTCCVAMGVMNLFLLAMLLAHDRKIDNLSDYLNAIYMQAPHLKPQEKST